jgi:hypothetical protein
MTSVLHCGFLGPKSSPRRRPGEDKHVAGVGKMSILESVIRMPITTLIGQCCLVFELEFIEILELVDLEAAYILAWVRWLARG